MGDHTKVESIQGLLYWNTSSWSTTPKNPNFSEFCLGSWHQPVVFQKVKVDKTSSIRLKNITTTKIPRIRQIEAVDRVNSRTSHWNWSVDFSNANTDRVLFARVEKKRKKEMNQTETGRKWTTTGGRTECLIGGGVHHGKRCPLPVFKGSRKVINTCKLVWTPSDGRINLNSPWMQSRQVF